MSDPFGPAIAAMEERLALEMKSVSETKRLINRLCEVAGRPAPYADIEEAASASISSIKPDTFYGKKMFSAIREYLDMRRAAKLGPAETREIYDAIVKGGFQFDTLDPNNAMTGMRSMMRKNSAMFHRLPNGAWGLTTWYESIKSSRAAVKNSAKPVADEEMESVDSEENETADDQGPSAAL